MYLKGGLAQLDSEHLSTKQEAAGSSPASPTTLPYQEPVWTMRIRVANGYRAVYCPSHPSAWPNGYVYEHRLVVEKRIGRLLQPGEVVHHRNEVRDDNSDDNLELLSTLDHMRHHHRPLKMVTANCLYCGKEFTRRAGYSMRHCSRRCNGSHSRAKQIASGMVNIRNPWKNKMPDGV